MRFNTVAGDSLRFSSPVGIAQILIGDLDVYATWHWKRLDLKHVYEHDQEDVTIPDLDPGEYRLAVTLQTGEIQDHFLRILPPLDIVPLALTPLELAAIHNELQHDLSELA